MTLEKFEQAERIINRYRVIKGDFKTILWHLQEVKREVGVMHDVIDKWAQEVRDYISGIEDREKEELSKI